MPAAIPGSGNLSASPRGRGPVYRSRGWGGHPASTFMPLPRGAGYQVNEFANYYQVVVEATGEPVGGYAAHLFTTVEAAEDFMKTLPPLPTWERVVASSGIPIQVEDGALFVGRAESSFGVFQESRYGTRLKGMKHGNVQGACLEFWELVEKQARANKKPADDFTKSRFREYGESPDNYIDWVVGGYPPGEYWQLF